jgi:hypothetical protein
MLAVCVVAAVLSHLHSRRSQSERYARGPMLRGPSARHVGLYVCPVTQALRR